MKVLFASTKGVLFVPQPQEGSGEDFCSFAPPPQSSLDFHMLFPSVLFVHFSLFFQWRKVSLVSEFKTMCLLALRLLA